MRGHAHDLRGPSGPRDRARDRARSSAARPTYAGPGSCPDLLLAEDVAGRSARMQCAHFARARSRPRKLRALHARNLSRYCPARYVLLAAAALPVRRTSCETKCARPRALRAGASRPRKLRAPQRAQLVSQRSHEQQQAPAGACCVRPLRKQHARVRACCVASSSSSIDARVRASMRTRCVTTPRARGVDPPLSSAACGGTSRGDGAHRDITKRALRAS